MMQNLQFLSEPASLEVDFEGRGCFYLPRCVFAAAALSESRKESESSSEVSKT